MTEVARCISPPPLIPVFPVVGTSEAAPLSMLPTNVKISSTFMEKKHLEPLVVLLVSLLLPSFAFITVKQHIQSGKVRSS